MWVFLASEILLFAGLFALYARVPRHVPGELRRGASRTTTLASAPSTPSSSSPAASRWRWRVHAVRAATRARARRSSSSRIAFGVVFLVLKGIEYAAALPRRASTRRAATTSPSMPAVRRADLLHALLLHDGAPRAPRHRRHGRARLARRARPARPALRGPSITSASSSARLYWHLVDIIWIFLWPLLYLAR